MKAHFLILLLLLLAGCDVFPRTSSGSGSASADGEWVLHIEGIPMPDVEGDVHGCRTEVPAALDLTVNRGVITGTHGEVRLVCELVLPEGVELAYQMKSGAVSGSTRADSMSLTLEGSDFVIAEDASHRIRAIHLTDLVISDTQAAAADMNAVIVQFLPRFKTHLVTGTGADALARLERPGGKP